MVLHIMVNYQINLAVCGCHQECREEVVPIGATIKDIARMLNLSHTTVSRALNDSSLVNPNTKRLILDMASQLNYVPNYSAKSLVRNRSYNIGLFFSTLAQYTSPHFFYETVKGVKSGISQHYNVVINDTESFRDFKFIDGRRYDGIIIMSQNEKDNALIYHIMDQEIPLVVLNREVSNTSILNVVSADRSGAYDAVLYLIDKGHARIAVIKGQKGFYAADERLEGYLNALIDRQISISEEHIVEGNYSMESGLHAMRRLLSASVVPSAVFSCNDDMAIGALKALSEQKIRVPEEISIVGFDDSGLSQFVTPSLTTVHRHLDQIGRLGALKLMSVVEDGNSYKNEKIFIPTTFIERDSVAVPSY